MAHGQDDQDNREGIRSNIRAGPYLFLDGRKARPPPGASLLLLLLLLFVSWRRSGRVSGLASRASTALVA